MTKKLLLVDDEADFLRALAFVLSTKGYAVETAFDGREALAVAASSAPDLILLDLMMPVFSGLETLSRLRENPALEAVPVIMMSGARPSLPGRDRNLLFLQKPFTFEQLLENVASMLDDGGGASD